MPKEHETPIYLWQYERDPEALTRPKSPNLRLNFTGKQSELLNDLYKYTIVPDAKLKKKLDFYYTPYNTKFLLRKHMTFEKSEENCIVEPVEKKDPGKSSSTGLMNETPAAPGDVSTNSKAQLNDKSVDGEAE